ncbi:MAG: phosphopantothenoylcysteine decarboxylase [Clostridiales bacterium]|nr:phosphopantothenoylcysteine decarboxylase [Clostridiales bacterium]
MNIVLGVSGSISAYKAADVTSALVKKGHDVQVVLTDGGSRFITALTLQTLSKRRVETDPFTEADPSVVKHIEMAQWADVVAVVPASADIIGKAASGIADDLLTSTIVAAANQAVMVMAPAMNTNMYENPIVQANIEKLKGYGFRFIEPKSALLACGTRGKGALADVDVIVEYLDSIDSREG